MNFLGVRIDPKFFPGILDGRAGEIEPAPIPANWHTDIAEVAGALRAASVGSLSPKTSSNKAAPQQEFRVFEAHLGGQGKVVSQILTLRIPHRRYSSPSTLGAFC
jgi:hypothetical protein